MPTTPIVRPSMSSIGRGRPLVGGLVAEEARAGRGSGPAGTSSRCGRSVPPRRPTTTYPHAPLAEPREDRVVGAGRERVQPAQVRRPDGRAHEVGAALRAGVGGEERQLDPVEVVVGARGRRRAARRRRGRRGGGDPVAEAVERRCRCRRGSGVAPSRRLRAGGPRGWRGRRRRAAAGGASWARTLVTTAYAGRNLPAVRADRDVIEPTRNRGLIERCGGRLRSQGGTRAMGIEDVAPILNDEANCMEQLAGRLEHLLPALRRGAAEEAASIAVNVRDFAGPAGAFDATTAEQTAARFERARRRLVTRSRTRSTLTPVTLRRPIGGGSRTPDTVTRCRERLAARRPGPRSVGRRAASRPVRPARRRRLTRP